MKNAAWTIALVLGSTNTFGQFEIRPHVGVNLQNLTEAPDSTTWKANPGFQVGGYFMFGNQFFIQPGIQYVTSKTELEYDASSNTDPTATLTIGTLRIPAVIGYRFSDPSGEPLINFRLFGGLAANFPLSAKFDVEGAADPELGSMNLALSAGLGLDISIFFVELGYDIGMTNVFDDEDFDIDAKQNQLQVNAGVRLKLAK